MRRALPFLLLCPLLTGCGLLRPKPPEYPPVELEGGLVVQDLVIPDDGPEARHLHFQVERLHEARDHVEGDPFAFAVAAGRRRR